ncbi:MAG: DUF1737 domain-containing protein [Micrococcales bacterium]
MTTAKPAAKTAAKTTDAKPAAKTAAAKPAAKPAATSAKKAVKPAAPAVAPEVADGDACALPTPGSETGPKKRFRMLTGIDDSAFCQKVSDALDDGYELYGSPTMTFNGTNVIVGQAVVLKKLPKKGKRK